MRYKTLALLMLAAMVMVPSPSLGQALIQNIIAGVEPINETSDVRLTRFGDATDEPSVSIGMHLQVGDLLESISGKTDVELECSGGGIFRLTGHYRVVISSHEAVDCRIDLFSGRLDAMADDESIEVNMGGVVLGTEGTEFWASLERYKHSVKRKIGVLDGAVSLWSKKQSGYAVVLTDAGENRITVIKIIREITGLGLRESKELVEAAPAIVVNGLAEPDAKALIIRLREAGAKAEAREPMQRVRLNAGRQLQIQPGGLYKKSALSNKEISNIAVLNARFDVSQVIRAGAKPEEIAVLTRRLTGLHYEVLTNPEDKTKRLELGAAQASYKLNNQALYQLKRADGLEKKTLQHYNVDPKLLREGLSPPNIKKLNKAKISSQSRPTSPTISKPSAPSDVKIISPVPLTSPTSTKPDDSKSRYKLKQ